MADQASVLMRAALRMEQGGLRSDKHGLANAEHPLAGGWHPISKRAQLHDDHCGQSRRRVHLARLRASLARCLVITSDRISRPAPDFARRVSLSTTRFQTRTHFTRSRTGRSRCRAQALTNGSLDRSAPTSLSAGRLGLGRVLWFPNPSRAQRPVLAWKRAAVRGAREATDEN